MSPDSNGSSNLSFLDVHQQEREEIEKRRAKQTYEPADRGTPAFAGLALSGGGIRSATFCLGFLQELQRLRLLRIFDYLSTVSGGGYVGGWWSAWLSRSEESLREIRKDPFFKADDIHDPISLLMKISEAADPISKDLRKQLEGTGGLSFIHLIKRGELNGHSSRLCETLVYILNTYISKAEALYKVDPNDGPEERESRILELGWNARVKLVEVFPCELRNLFPPAEKIEFERAKMLDAKASDGSRCAWVDPIHHLRLFANYLTPRKGILSADTWRAITVITRNLTFTWLILLPLLIGVMLLGQAYFLLNGTTREAFINPNTTGALGTAFCLILIPVGVLLVTSVLMAIAWLLCNRDNSSSQDSTVQTTCVIALAVLLFYAAAAIPLLREWFTNVFNASENFFVSIRNSTLTPQQYMPIIQLRLIVAWAVLTFVGILVMWYWKLDSRSFPPTDPETLSRWKRDVRRGRFSRAQAKLLVTTAIVAAVLLLSWFSCFLTKDFSFLNFSWRIPITLVPLISAIGGSIFTALRATPATSGDRSRSREPTLVTRIIFAATPPLVIGVLAVLAAWSSHSLLVYYLNPGSAVIRPFLKVAAILAIALCIGLALYEMQNLRWSKILRPALVPIAFLCLLMITLSWTGQAIVRYASANPEPDWSLVLGSIVVGALITVLVFRRVIPRGKWSWRLLRRLNLVKAAEKHKRHRHQTIVRKFQAGSILAFIVLAGTLTVVGFLIGLAIYLSTNEEETGVLLRAFVFTIVGLSGGVILFRFFVTRSENKAGESVIELYFGKEKSFRKRPESLWLLASICLTLPIAMMTIAHYVRWRGRSHPLDSFTEAPSLFPISVGFLLFTLMLLRSFVIQKRLAEKRDLAPWSDGIFKWLKVNIPRAEKHPNRVYEALAFLGVCLTPLIDIVSKAISLELPAAQMIMPFSWKISLAALFVSLPLFGVSVFQLPFRANLDEVFSGTQRRVLHSQAVLWILASCCIVLAFIAGMLLPNWLAHISEITLNKGFTTILLPVAFGCFLIVLFEIYWGQYDNRRSLNLIVLAYAAIVSIFFLRLTGAGAEWNLVPGLLAAICVWVGALGWMVDPNAVSMHQFYKSRLVRAYLGASNVRRLIHRSKEITESVAGDDLQLKSLQNCDRGGPYHIVNTTLNLVAGRDLATAQRSASSFVLSHKYCGSARTNYCSTDEYMDGQLTLGTAVAASGAAVSPNMGAKKPTAALAMLMTLLNVRLGYWAPTPNREDWNSSQPRLWPFYLVREFLSQTNDLSDYCYLTDGGHFDNTGLYSLIERGCRYVVLVDCGADPKPSCFEDFGEAIRRCRIDFGTEIDLSLDPFIQTQCGKGDECFAVGKILFSREHLRGLGHDVDNMTDDELTGTIVYFKPAVMENVTPDVRQYAIENKNFPQQSTTNQWFDEAQFESYRRLGQLSANQAFDFVKDKRISKSAGVSLEDIEELFQELRKRC